MALRDQPDGVRSQVIVCGSHVHVSLVCPFHSMKATYERDDDEHGNMTGFAMSARRLIEADHAELYHA